MSDFFCDHENTTLYTTALTATPAWGQPQEGDGTASGSGAAPAVPIGSVVFSASTGTPTAGSVSILGSSAIVPSYSSNLDTQANNLATAINASTAAVTLPAKAGNIASCYVKALVYARGPAGGAPAGTCQIMSRVATDAFNSGVNVAVAAWNNMTATPSDMRGGVSGPWRYFFNPTALTSNVSATIGAAGSYGAVTATLLGTVTNGDTIHVRTKRAGANVVLPWSTASTTVTTRAIGTFASPMALVFDNGNKWAGDAGVFIMTMNASLTVNRYFQVPTTVGLKQIWYGTRLSDTTCNWRIELQNVPQPANYVFSLGGNVSAVPNAVEIVGCEISGAAGAPIDNTNSAYAYVQVRSPIGAMLPREAPSLLVRDFLFKSKGKVSPYVFAGGGSYFSHTRAENCLLDHTGLSVASDEAILAYSTTGDGKFEAYGCRWVGFPAAANQSGVQKYASRRLVVRLQDCAFDNIKLSGGLANGGLVGASEDVTNPFVDWVRSITVLSSLGNRPFVFENSRRSFAWFDSAAPRTTGSLLPDGTTNFSVRTAVTTETGNVAPWYPVLFPRLAKHNGLSSGTRTATLRLLVDNNLRTALGGRDPNNRELWITVSYVATDGLPKSVTSRADLLSAGTALSAGNAGDWSATSYDVNGVTHNYTPFQISVSCPAMQTLTEAGLVLGQGFQGSSVDDLIFVDPEWSLT